MSEAPVATSPEVVLFGTLDATLRDQGAAAAIDRLIASLEAREEARPLLDALLLKARHELGLPLVQVGGFAEIPEGLRAAYEDRYIEAIRTVGQKLLDRGDIPGAWPYFRTIGENEAVVRAIEAYEPGENDERLGQVVEVAFHQGAAPRKGFELILKHYGTCSAITAFEHLPRDEATRVACADKLVRQVHDHLVASLRGEIAQRGQPLPKEGAPIGELIEGRPWLFAEDAYHLDVSHLAATVRVAPMLNDLETIEYAVQLTDYGRNLSERHKYEGDPPFENLYEDHALYLNALLGRNVDPAIAHFEAKLGGPPPSDDPEMMEGSNDDLATAQVLVGLLVRLGRLEPAIDLAATYLAGVPETSLFCPGLSQLCQRAGKPERLARISRERGDLVNYLAAILQGAEGDGPSRAS